MLFLRAGLNGLREFGFAAALAVSAASARADVIISSNATQNMSCSSGICAPTAASAVLNVADLESYLASGNIEVTMTGSGGVQANNIDVDTPLSWSSSSALSLVATQALTVDREISVNGAGGLTLDAINELLLSFGKNGHVVFQNLSNPLTINYTAYTLVDSIKALANAVANNPSGAYALANSYDASADGTYVASTIQTTLTGSFNGLGNAITRLSIKPPGSGFYGLFELASGHIDNLHVLHATIVVKDGSTAGIISSVGGQTTHVSVSGTIIGRGLYVNTVGGLSGGGGTLVACSADVKIVGESRTAAGVLVMGNGGITEQSFATGSIVVPDNSIAGGLAATNYLDISNSYSTVSVKAGAHSRVGGFVGVNGETQGIGAGIDSSYSTGAVSGGPHSKVGGYAGTAFPPTKRNNVHVYWDTETSGTDEGTGRGNKAGITGLTSGQLRLGLPLGFDPAIWTQNPKINNGFPYLIANPPRE